MGDKFSGRIKYNLAMDFINSVFKYKEYQIFFDKPNHSDVENDIIKHNVAFVRNKDLLDWLDNINKKISPIFKNQFTFVVDDSLGLLNVCYSVIEINQIEHPLELIDALNSLDTDTMVEISYKFYNLDIPLDNDVLLKEALLSNYNENIANSFLDYKNNPNEYKENFINTLKIFYKDFFKPIENDVLIFMEDRLVIINEAFKKDPMYFINSMGKGDYTKAIDMHKNFTIYMSYFLDIGFMYLTHKDSLIILCGHNFEYIFNNKEREDNYINLFKALADEKRLAILKLTSERPWYNKELADYFNLTPATLSYHLSLLMNTGILSFEPSIINNRYYYTTNKEKLKELFDAALLDLIF